MPIYCNAEDFTSEERERIVEEAWHDAHPNCETCGKYICLGTETMRDCGCGLPVGTQAEGLNVCTGACVADVVAESIRIERAARS